MRRMIRLKTALRALAPFVAAVFVSAACSTRWGDFEPRDGGAGGAYGSAGTASTGGSGDAGVDACLSDGGCP